MGYEYDTLYYHLGFMFIKSRYLNYLFSSLWHSFYEKRTVNARFDLLWLCAQIYSRDCVVFDALAPDHSFYDLVTSRGEQR